VNQEPSGADLESLRRRIGELEDRLAAEREERDALRAELAAARNDLERANRARAEFFSRVSHELRTPLNAILGFGQLLEMGGLSDADRDSVHQILKAGRRLLGTIDQVLEYSRMESGRTAISIEPVVLGPVLRQAIDLVLPGAAEKGVVIAETVSAAGWVVLADRRLLGQVFLQLLSNAVKFNRPGGRVEIAARRTNVHLEIAVVDTGVGIPADQLERIFEPFVSRSPDPTVGPSLGLGLAYAKLLTEAMAGRISAESVFGQGSTFRVRLPLAAEGAAELEGTGPAEGPFGQTILYIEDNLANLDLVERALRRWTRARMLAAMQGSLGLELAREHRPDLILLDLHLPDLGPEETLRQLKADPRTRDIPVVVLSSDPRVDDPGRLRLLGAYEYLPKPIDVARLVGVIEEIVRARGP
jgi:signal transduction histidine kinase/CheY-like chemotaxis protein